MRTSSTATVAADAENKVSPSSVAASGAHDCTKVEALTSGAIRADELAAEAPPTGARARRPRVAREDAAGQPAPGRLPQPAPASPPAVPGPVAPAGDLAVGLAANARVALGKLVGIPIEPGLSEDELLDRLRGPLFPVPSSRASGWSSRPEPRARASGPSTASPTGCTAPATQRIVDATPRPPALDVEVIAAFERIVGVTPAALPSAALPPKEDTPCPRA